MARESVCIAHQIDGECKERTALSDRSSEMAEEVQRGRESFLVEQTRLWKSPSSSAQLAWSALASSCTPLVNEIHFTIDHFYELVPTRQLQS